MKILVLLFFLPLRIYAGESYIPFGKVLQDEGYQLNLIGEYWQSDSRYDVNGEEQAFLEGEGFTSARGTLLGEYGLTDNLQAGLGVSYVSNQSTYQTNSIPDSATGSGLESTIVTLKYGFKQVDNLLYALEGYYQHSLYTNDVYNSSNQETMVLGDDGSHYGGGLSVTYHHGEGGFLNGRLHYNRPGSTQSDEMLYHFEGAKAWKYFTFRAGVLGVYSLGQDAYSSDPQNKPQVHNGVTYRYNSVNREFTEGYIGGNIPLGDGWRIEAQAGQVFQATSYDVGQRFLVRLAKRVEPQSKETADSRFKQYSIEANVVKVSPKKSYVIIDKGVEDGISEGMIFDLFHFDYLGGNTLLARGKVVKLASSKAVVQLIKRYSVKFELKDGVLARGLTR